MSGALRRAWRARPSTFVVHVALGLAGLLAGLPSAALVGSALGAHPAGEAWLRAPGGDAWLELARGWGLALQATLVVPALVAILVGVASGPICCAWIEAIARGDRGAGELGRAATRLATRAWALDACFVVIRAAVLALAAGAALITARVAGSLGDDRTALLVSAAVALVVASLLLPVGAAADVARARCALAGARPLAAVLAGLWTTIRHPLALGAAYAGAAAVGLALAVTAIAAGELLADGAPASAIALVIAQQSLLLSRSFVRSVWLAVVVRHASPVVDTDRGEPATA